MISLQHIETVRNQYERDKVEAAQAALRQFSLYEHDPYLAMQMAFEELADWTGLELNKELKRAYSYASANLGRK